VHAVVHTASILAGEPTYFIGRVDNEGSDIHLLSNNRMVAITIPHAIQLASFW
jgi:hypothetical protein